MLVLNSLLKIMNHELHRRFRKTNCVLTSFNEIALWRRTFDIAIRDNLLQSFKSSQSSQGYRTWWTVPPHFINCLKRDDLLRIQLLIAVIPYPDSPSIGGCTEYLHYLSDQIP